MKVQIFPVSQLIVFSLLFLDPEAHSCLLHFRDEDLEYSNFSGRWFVKTGSLPSVFKCWEHKPYLIPKSQKKRKLNKIQLQSSETSCKRQQSDQNYGTECTPEPAEVCGESYYDEAAGEDSDEIEAEKSERLKAEILSLREQIKLPTQKSSSSSKLCKKWSSALKILKTKIYVFTLDSRIVTSTKQC